MFNPVCNKKGVTLIEATIASSIMALGLFAVGTAIYSQFSSLNQNREKAIATLAAQGEIESIRGMAFDSILPLTSFDETSAPGLAYLHYEEGFGRGDIEVDSAGFISGPDIRKISVIVTWDSMSGKRLERRLVTFVTRDGINKR